MNKRGYSILEFTIAAGVVALAGLLMTYVFDRISDTSILSANNQFFANTVREAEVLALRTFGSVNPRDFDPRSTYVGTASAHAFAGPSWTVKGTTIGFASITPFVIGGQAVTMDSHSFPVYNVRTEAGTGAMQRVPLMAVLARCIPAASDGTLTKLEDINALRRPLVLGGAVHCCPVGAGCPDSESNNFSHWPSLIYYKGEGADNISVFPPPRSRDVAPGISFYLIFDKNPEPSKFKLMRIVMQNHCRLSKSGHGTRSPSNCARTKLGIVPTPEYPDPKLYYDVDVANYTKISETDREIAADAASTGYIVTQ